jgi:hypothetical protein
VTVDVQADRKVYMMALMMVDCSESRMDYVRVGLKADGMAVSKESLMADSMELHLAAQMADQMVIMMVV